ncbi:MAG TPA: ATP-binding protein [Polyangia bacterium]|jgi:signal transduction histidine kinase
MTALFWSTDRELRILACRGRSLPGLKLAPEAMVGARVTDVFAAPDDPVVAAHRRALQGEESSVTLSAGEASFDVRVRPVRDDSGRIVGAAGLAVDRSAVRRLEDARDEQLRTVSHDLRGPLSVISGHAQILQREFQRSGGSERAQNSGASILRATRRLNTMIDELVDSARLEAGRLAITRRPVRLRALLDAVRDRLGAATLDPDRLRIEVSPELPPVLADPDRLERVIMNIVLYTARHAAPNTPLVATAAVAEGRVRVQITCQGAELAPEELPRIFDKLHHTKDPNRVDGLGLELYIAKLLIAAHGGTLAAVSEPGEVTTFVFDLPQA